MAQPLLERTWTVSTAMLHILSLKRKMHYGSVSNLAGTTPQSRLSTAPSFDGVSKFYSSWNKYSFCLQGFLQGNQDFMLRKLFAKCKVSFPFCFCFHVRVLNVWSWSWTCECQTWVLVFFFCPFTYSQAMNRALVGMWHSTTRVRVTLFHLEEVIYLCLMLIISLRLTNLFIYPNLSAYVYI